MERIKRPTNKTMNISETMVCVLGAQGLFVEEDEDDDDLLEEEEEDEAEEEETEEIIRPLFKM